MKRFVEIEYWYYIDANPRTDVMFFSGDTEEELENEVNGFVSRMKKNWCEGTTRLIGIMDANKAFDFVEKQIAKEHKNPQEDSEEFITNLCNMYKECYGEDAVELLHKLDMADDYASNQ